MSEHISPDETDPWEDEPPLLRAPDEMPAVHNVHDLELLWRALQAGMDFGSASLWFLLLRSDGQPTPSLVEVADCPETPAREALENLLATIAHCVREDENLGSVAFLRSRPGPARLTHADKVWAARLLATARTAGVPTWPVHVAAGSRLLPVGADDLAA